MCMYSENGPILKNMSQEEIDQFIRSNGHKKFAELFETQCKDDLRKEEKSSLKIRIELNLDVEVHLTARVKGDVVIGLL